MARRGSPTYDPRPAIRMRLLAFVVPVLIVTGVFLFQQYATSHFSTTASGTGSGPSGYFRLEPGSYDVAWTVSPPAENAGGCDATIDLDESDGTLYRKLASWRIPGPSAGTGQAAIDLPDPQAFVVQVTTTCGAWSVVFTPRGG